MRWVLAPVQPVMEFLLTTAFHWKDTFMMVVIQAETWSMPHGMTHLAQTGNLLSMHNLHCSSTRGQYSYWMVVTSPLSAPRDFPTPQQQETYT